MRSGQTAIVDDPVYAIPDRTGNGPVSRRRAGDQLAWRFTLDRAGRAVSVEAFGGQEGFGEAAPDGRCFAEVVAQFGACSCDLDAVLAEAKELGWAERECWATRTDGSRIWCSIMITCFGANEGAPMGYAVVLRDLTERKRSEAELRRQAETDPLTGILNRRSFLKMAAQTMNRRVPQTESVAFAMLDLDRFKGINDRHGHAAGDMALRRVVDSISRNLRKSDLLGRVGGDEFGLLLTGVSRTHACMLLQRLRRIVFSEEVVIEGQRLDLSISFGLAIRQSDETVERLMARADRALIAAKNLGRRQIRLTR